MSNLLIIMIVAYIATVIIQIGYFATYYNNVPISYDFLAIVIIIASIAFAPIMVLLEIGAALLFAKLNN